MSTLRPLLIASAALLLAACSALGPDYQRPQLDVPVSLDNPKAQTSSAVPTTVANGWQQWWQSFQDPVLDVLMDEATANNQDLRLAAARVEEARAVLASALSDSYPTVDAALSTGKSRTSANSGTLPSNAQLIRKHDEIGLNAAYEIDLWGKLSRATEAARARMLSQEANRDVVRAALYTYLMHTYFALRSYDAQLALAESTFSTRQENLRLQEKRFTAGSISKLDLDFALSEVAATEIAAAQTRQSVAITESALAVLLGRAPSGIARPAIARGLGIDTLHANLILPTELPSDLLNRRPDIIAAEQALIAANADIGQAKAQYFPNIKLVTGMGRESASLHTLLSSESLFWNIAANLTQPIFRAGAVGALLKNAEAHKTQALAQYVQAVQNAFRDVHDALANLSANEQIQEATKRRAATLRESLRLTNLRYQNGYSSFLEVLNAQRDLLQTESSLIDAERAHLSAAVSLYKAVATFEADASQAPQKLHSH